LQVWHVGFALWAFSIFGVPRSPIITEAFAALVLRICTAMSVVWANAGSMTPQQVAQRLLAGSSAHLLVAAIVLVGVLFLKVTFTNWIKVSSACHEQPSTKEYCQHMHATCPCFLGLLGSRLPRVSSVC
jgi:hypothetical protein